MTEHTAGVNWDRVFQVLYGHPAELDEPEYLKVMKLLARDLVSSILTRSREVIRQVTFLTDHHLGLAYLQYVFFVLMEQSRNWPSLTKEHLAALHLLRTILAESGDTPTYTNGLRVPPPELEQKLDAVLLGLATWAKTELAVGLRRDYRTTVKKFTPKILKTVPPPVGMSPEMHVAFLFETSLENSPMAFPGGHLLGYALSTIF